MSVLNQSGDEQVECPLCMEPLEVDDLNFFPCTCGYQICRFCWHRIRTDENGLCPACRKAYPEDPADFKPLTQEEIAKLKAEKRQRDSRRKNKLSEGRRHLANVRVVQSNLVFVVGLPLRLADPEVLKKYDYFGKYGKIHKVVINQSTSYAGSQGPSASAYVTYSRAEEALRAIQAVSSVMMDGRPLKASLGTTKYCAHFMKGLSCPKPDCMYLHELGDREASFTKEEMQQGKHTEYERKLHEQLNVSSAPTATAPLSNHLTSSPSPSSASPSSSSSSSSSSISLSSGSSSASIPPASLTHNHINCKEGKKLGGSSCSPPSQTLQQQSIQCLGAAPNILNQHHPPHQNLSQQQSAAWSSNGNSGTNVILGSGGGERGSGGNNRRGKGGGSSSNSSNNNISGQRRRHTSGDDIPKGKNRDKQQTNGMSSSGNRGSKGGPSPSPPLSSSVPRKVNSSGNGAPGRGTSSNTGSLPTSLTARSQSGKSGQSTHPHAQNPSQDTGQNDIQDDTIMNQDFQNEEQLQGIQQTGNQRQGGALKGALSGLALSPRLQWRMGAALFGAPEQDNNSFFSSHHCFPMRSIVRPQATATSPRGSLDGVGSSAGPGTSHPSDEISLHSSPPSSPSPSPSSSSSASSPTSSSPSMALLPNGIGSSSVATSLGSNEWVSGVGSNLEGGLAIPDALPAIHSTTDWQAAFGFSNSQTQSFGELERRARPELEPLGHGLEGLGMSRSHDDSEVVSGIPPGISNSLRNSHISCVPLAGGRSVDDDLGFDPFHETQKALAEMMEKEDQQMLRSQQQSELEVGQQCLHINDQMHQDMQREQLGSIGPIHHLPQNYPPPHLRHTVAGGLGDGTPMPPSSVNPKPTQALHSPLAPHIQRGVSLPGASGGRPGPPLPPPGFSAPNHMNAFGLGIPRPPSGAAGSKILPFMGLGSAASSSVAIPGPPSPSLSGGVSGGNPFGSIMCNGPSPPTMPNGPSSNCPPSPHAPLTKGEVRKLGESGAFNMREFHDGLRAILPGLGMPKGMVQHPPAQQQQQDWTALDPAIVSSTPHLHTSHSTGSLNLAHSHWAKSLETLSTAPLLNQPSSASTSQLPPSTADHHYYRGHGHFQDFGGSSVGGGGGGGGWSTQMNSGVHLGSVTIGGPGRYQPNLLQMQPQQQPGLMGGHQVHPFLMRPQDVGNSGPSPAAPPPGFNPLRSSKTVPEVAGMGTVYESRWYIGCVVQTVEDGEILVNFMTPDGKAKSYMWPKHVDECWIPSTDVLIQVPVPKTITGRQYTLPDCTVAAIEKAWNAYHQA